MKTRKTKLLQVASAAVLAFTAASASAASLYWDTDGATAGSGGTMPSGTWATSGTTWSTDSTGATATSALTTAGIDDLFFSAGSDATGSYTVTLGANQAAKSLTFEEGVTTLTANQVTLTGGGITVLAGSGDPTIGSTLAINGNGIFNVGDGRTLLLDTGAFTRGNRATLNVQLGTGSTLTSTKTGLAAGGIVNGIIGPWASIGTGTSTRYATFTGNNITALTGTTAASAANVTDTGGTFNYDMGGGAATFGAGANINTLRYTGGGATITATNTLITKGIMNAGTGGLTFNGAVTAGLGAGAGTSATEIIINTANGDIAMTGGSALFTGTIGKTGSGTFTLGAGAAHSIGFINVNQGTIVTNTSAGDGLPGATINSGGTLRWGGSSKHGNGAVFTINAGGTLDIQGFDDLIGNINGAGNITGTTGRIQVQNATATFSGVISGSGVRFLVNDDGANNNYTLSGLNTYGGTTTLERGTLRINSIGNVVVGGPGVASAIGAPTTVANGNIAIGRLGFTGTLVYTGTGHSTDRQITIGTNTATTAANTDTGGATIEANGASNAALTFSATTFNTQTNATAGVGADRVLTLQGASTGLNTISGIIQDNLVSGSATGTAKVGVTKAQAGTWVLSGNNTYTGNTTLTLGTLNLGVAENADVTGPLGKQLANAAGTIVLGGGTLQYSAANQFDYSGRFSTAASQAYNVDTNGQDVTWGANLTSSGGTLAKSGAGILTLTGANSFGGATTISGGTLKLTGSGRLGSGNYSGAVALTNSAVFDKSSTTTQIMSGNITGATGTVKLDNANGELILRGSGNSYGTLNINAGRLFIQISSAALPAAATVNLTGGTLDFDVAGTYGNVITVSSGANIAARAATTLSNVVLPGSGTVIFNNDDLATTTLSIGGNQILTGSLTVQVGNVGGGGNATVGAVTLAGDISGSGFGLNKTQVGTLVLAGTNTYTGPTTVTTGTLAVTGSLGATAVTVNSPAILSGNGNIGGDVTIDSGATHALAVAATPGAQVIRAITGTLTLTAGNLLDLTAAATPVAGEYVLATADTISGTTAEGDIDYNGITGTVSIDTASNPDRLLLTVTAANNYASWAADQSPPVIEGPNGDDDKDGVKNLIEYALADGEERGTFTGTSLSFTKRGAPYGGDLIYAIEESTELGGIGNPWAEVVHNPPTNPYVNDASTISYTITPGTPAKNFFRLQVIQTTP